jgi:trimeric autotransporter adhesin
MKKVILLLLVVCASFQIFAQAPATLNYQGVARNSVGNALPGQNLSVRLSIRDGAPAGPVVYTETRAVTTNAFGLYNVVIGSPGATSVTGTVAGVNWFVGSKYLQVET